MPKARALEIVCDQDAPSFFHSLRRGSGGCDIGSSEAGTAIQTLERAYPRDLFRHIIGHPDYQREPGPEPDACAHGHRCEPLIADQYVAITGAIIRPGNTFKANGQGSSPDRKVYDQEGNWVGLLEIKAPFHRMYDTGSLKRDHLVQVGAIVRGK